jgi:hypothetical protein
LVSPLLLHTIVWPFGLGIVLAIVISLRGNSAGIHVFIATAMMVAIYALLEGFPSFPPVAAKQKLGFLIAAIAAAVSAASRFRLDRRFVTIAVLAAGFAWLGLNKLSGASAWPLVPPMLAPVAAAALASRSLETRADELFLWPASLLAFAIGASLLSLFGVFVGFAQDMGAMAAWLGGFMLSQFGLVAIGRKANTLPPAVLQAVLLSLVSMSFMVALFAPDVSLLAFAILSLTLLVPRFAPGLRGLSAIGRPFAFGFLAAVPAVAAILIAFVQRGLSLG